MEKHLLDFDNEEISSNYIKFRPRYPSEVYEKFLKYHDGNSSETRRNLAIDVGCGSGQGTVGLANYFNKVIGIDSSKCQIAEAKQHNSGSHSNIVYEVCSAEKISRIVPEESVDLVATFMALFHLDMKSFAEESLKVLKPGGTFAAYFQKPMELGNKTANEYYTQFMQKFHKPYLEDREVEIVNNYVEIFNDFPKFFDECVRDESSCMTVPLSLNALRGLILCVPQYHRYKAKFPDLPDELDRLIERLKELYGTNSLEETVDSYIINIVLMFGRKK